MSIFELRQSKLGMTLVEMVVSLVILSILITSTMGMIISSNSIFLSTSAAAIDKQIGNYIFKTLESSLRYSTSVGIVNHGSAGLTGYAQRFTIAEDDGFYDGDTESGRLSYMSEKFYEMKNGNKVPKHFYDESFYGNRTVQYQIRSAGNDNKHVKITVTVFRHGNPVYTRDAVIKCVNLALMASGQHGNPLNDKSSSGTVNQDVYFTCDESLIDASSQTWILEYQIKEFREGYNAILDEYTNALINAQSTLTGYLENYKDDSGNWTQSIEKGVIQTAIENRNKAFFGDTTVTASTKNYYNFEAITDNGDGTISVAGCNNTDTNLRKYYQAKMYNYLGFSPMETEGYANGYFNFGGSDSWQIIQGMGKNNDYAYVPELLSDGSPNPYYGVCATREQLYFAFLCQYNSDDDTTVGGSLTATKKNVKKADYAVPDKNAKALFEGTMFDNGGDHSYAEDMVVLSYFIEDPSKGALASFYSTNGGKQAPASTYKENIPYYEKGDCYSSDWATNVATTSVDGVGSSTDSLITNTGSTGYKVNTSLLENPVNDTLVFSLDNLSWKYDYSKGNLTFSGIDHKYDYTYYYLSDVDSGNKTLKLNRTNQHVEHDGYRGTDKNFTDIYTKFYVPNYSADAAKINSVNTVTTDLTNNYLNAKPISDYASFGGKSNLSVVLAGQTISMKKLVFTANKDIPEGWYYYFDQAGSNVSSQNNFRRIGHYFFYLKADESAKNATNGYAVAKSTNVMLGVVNDYVLTYLRYQRAKFAGSGSGATYDVIQNRNINDVLYYKLNGHNYSEEILYGVEWSTWFGEAEKGLLNNVVRSATDAVSNLVFNVIGVKGSFTEGITFPTSGLTKTNAYRVLGNNVTLQVNNTNIGRSYQAAWIVYNNNRSKWYYLPAKSNRITSWATGKDWSSYTDTPTILNVEGWGSQSKMISDIESRQLSSSAVFGLVNTTSDAIWIALPSTTETLTMSTVTGSLDALSITGANMSSGFSASTRAYSATASVSGTSPETTIPVYVTANSAHEDYTIEISYNGQLVEKSNNGSITNAKIDIPLPGAAQAVDNEVTRHQGGLIFGDDVYDYTLRKFYDLEAPAIVVTVTTSEYVSQRYTINVKTSRGDYKFNKNTGAIVN